MVVDVTTEPTFSRGRPRLLFEGPYAWFTPTRSYDISPDGERFIMLSMHVNEPGVTQITIVLNWFEDLKKRVPI